MPELSDVAMHHNEGVSSFPRGYLVGTCGGHDFRGTKPLAAM